MKTPWRGGFVTFSRQRVTTTQQQRKGLLWTNLMRGQFGDVVTEVSSKHRIYVYVGVKLPNKIKYELCVELL